MNISKNDKIKLAQRIAWIAAGFALIMAVLLIANFAQTKLNKPIDNKTIPALVKRLSESPGDETLKAEIRAFDLMARKAYFSSQWQIRTGIYLMFLGIIISILAIRFVLSEKSKLNEIDRANEVEGLDKLVAQKWVIYVGSGLIVVALASGFLSSNSLKEYMVNENIVAIEDSSAIPAASAEQAFAPAEQTAQAAAPVTNANATTENVASANPSETPSASALATETAVAKPAGLPTQAELKANYPFFRGSQGDGVAFQKNTPTDWNGAGSKVLACSDSFCTTTFSF